MNRRLSRIGITIALVIPLVMTSRPAPADQSRSAAVRVTYETGTKDSGYAGMGFNECCPHSLRIDDLARRGAYALRADLRYGDPQAAGGTRAESHTLRMSATHYRAGDTRYYGVSIYIPSTWQTDTREDIVFQWHKLKDSCDDPVRSPSAFLAVMPNGTWRLRTNHDANACSTPTSVGKLAYDLGPATPGRWHDFVFRIKWSYTDTDTDTGTIQTWHKTNVITTWTKVLDTIGPNTYNDQPASIGYLKWGIYKPAWNTAPTAVTQRLVWHDNIAVGETFADVDPSAG